MKKILRYMRGSWHIALLAPLLMILEVTMDLLQPTLMEKIIDVGIANQDIPYVLQTGGQMLLVAFIGVIGGAGCAIFSSIAALRFGAKLRQSVFDRVQTFSFAELDKLKLSSLVTRMTNDVTQLQNMVMMGLRMLVRAPMQCFGSLAFAFAVSPKLSLIFAAAMPLLLGAMFYAMHKVFPLFSTMQQRIDRVNAVIRENLLGVRVIKAFAKQDTERARFGKANDDLKNQSLTAFNTIVIMFPVINMVVNLSVVALFWFGGSMTIAGTLESGKIMAFMQYLVQALFALISVAMMGSGFARAQASAQRINEVLETQTSIADPLVPVAPQGISVEFDHVYFRYNEAAEGDEEKYVLRDVCFRAENGQTIGIIGGTGSGKSTFISLIPRLYDATRGTVKLGGVDVRQISLKTLRDKVGIVLQDSVLFSGTVEENLRWGDANMSAAKMEQALRDAQAYDFTIGAGRGGDAIVEQRGKNFSGGQKQRLSIARTFAKEPDVLILDDSTSAVDLATEAQIQKALRTRRKEGIVFIIAQRISAIADADQIIVLDEGRVESIGTHRQLLQESPIYRAIAVSQLGEEVLQNA